MKKTVAIGLLVVVVLTSGCVWILNEPHPTGPPHPVPDTEFNYSFDTQNGSHVMSITLVSSEPLVNASNRIYVGDTLVYDDGKFSDGYEQSYRFQNEWQDGIRPGDTIKVAKDDHFPWDKRVRVQVNASSHEGYIGVGGTRTPRTDIQFGYQYNHTANATKIRIQSLSGDEIDASEVYVTVGGRDAFRNGTFQNGFGSGDGAENGWQSDVAVNSTLVLSNGSRVATETDVQVWWKGKHLLGEDRVKSADTSHSTKGRS